LIVNSPPSELERKLDLVADGVGLYDPIKNERIVALSSIAYNNQTAKQSLMSDIRGYVRLFTKMSLTNTLSSNAVETMLMAMVEKKDPYGIMEFNDVVNSFKRGIDQIIETKMPKDPNLESTTALQKLAANTTPTKINILNFKHYFNMAKGTEQGIFTYHRRSRVTFLILLVCQLSLEIFSQTEDERSLTNILAAIINQAHHHLLQILMELHMRYQVINILRLRALRALEKK
jgi:hypothetical protein